MLTLNGAIFTAESRHGPCAMESELARLGVAYKHSKPYHPQTCGKVERFHQTLKKHLARQRRAATLSQLQAQLDRYARYYNSVRPDWSSAAAPRRSLRRPHQSDPHPDTVVVEGHHRSAGTGWTRAAG